MNARTRYLDDALAPASADSVPPAPTRAQRVRRWLWRMGRHAWMFLINYPLRPVMVAWTRPRFLFAIYGNKRQVSAYYSDLLLPLVPDVGIGGVARVAGQRGFVVGSRYMEHELEHEPEKLAAYLRSLEQAFPSAERIALVGRLPTFVRKAGLPIGDRFVEGTAGTRFLLRQVARKLRAQRPDVSSTIVVLGGAGRVGSLVCHDMRGIVERVIAFDPRYEQEKEVRRDGLLVLRTGRPYRLREARLFINLTRTGDDIEGLVDFLPPGGLLADDTHPGITPEVRFQLQERGIEVQKAAIAHNAFRLFPRLPAWHSHQVPGCVVEALTLLSEPNVDIEDLDAFDRVAARLGFYGALESPRQHD